MASVGIFSKEERAFITGGIEFDFRTDGRSYTDYRHFTIKTGVISSANGSSEVKLGKTHVMVGIKAELGEPDALAPNSGTLNFFVECTANASPNFEGKGGDEISWELSNGLAQVINCQTLDLKSLLIVPFKHCWALFIDVVVLECDGNLFDACSLAVKAALSNTQIPKLIISGDSDEIDIDVSDDQYDTQEIDVANVPIIVTANKIGRRFIFDATIEEESCVDVKMLVAVNGLGKICQIQKYGHEGLNPELTFEMIEVAKQVGESLNRSFLKALNTSGTR